jgi:hypothetical protein
MTRDQVLDLVDKGECGCKECRALLARTIARLVANGLMEFDAPGQAPDCTPIKVPVVYVEHQDGYHVPVKTESARENLRRAGFTILSTGT